MDEKESIPEAPSTQVADKGDSADSEKPSSESVQEMSAVGGANIDNEATQSEAESELQNHVDHKVVDTPSSTTKEVDHDIMSSAKNADDYPDEKNIGKSLSCTS